MWRFIHHRDSLLLMAWSHYLASKGNTCLEDKINYVTNACLFIYIFPCGFLATKRSIWGFLVFKILYIMFEMVCIYALELNCFVVVLLCMSICYWSIDAK